jgi:stalled ribosome alternative rescue factor ArfA
MKKKKEIIHIKVDQTKLPNKMHFETQLKTRSHVFKPKKGKGSFKRNKRVNDE